MSYLRPSHVNATFQNELKHAAVCCKVVEKTRWDSSQGEVMMLAREEGADRVTTVSKLSGGACRQQIMVFEAEGLGSGGTTYIVAFRSGKASTYPKAIAEGGYHRSCSSQYDHGLQVREGVDQELWELAASVPLQSLPPQWHQGLREGRDRLILTGFSVGGAVAAVTTLQLLENEVHDAMRNQIRCLTFGAPLQGDESYADRIDRSFQKHFYHAVYYGDPIPGMLTLVKKAGKDKRLSRDLYISVLAGICALTGIAAGIAVAVLAPAAGIPLILPSLAVALQAPVTLDKLAADFKKLSRDVQETKQSTLRSTALPEYEFCGNLLVLRTEFDEEIRSVSRSGNSAFLKKVFREVPNNVSAESLRKNSERKISEYSLEWYIEVIKKVHRRWRAPSVEVAESSGCFPSRGRNINRWLLEPRLRDDNPVSVFLHQSGRNITVMVYGENIVLGVHVSYLDKDGVIKLQLPCTGSPWWSLEDAAMSSVGAGLQFCGHLGDNNFSFTDGSFIVELAFGSLRSEARQSPRKLCPMEDIYVAPRYAYLPPQELVELLITLIKADALAMCHTAFIAIQNNESESRVREATVRDFHNDKSQFNECLKLLDRFLHLMGADQLAWGDRQALPAKMQIELGNKKMNDKRITPLFPKEKAASWTFSGCFKSAVQPMLSVEKLRGEETAKELREKLDVKLELPHKVLKASLESELDVRNFAKGFSFKDLKTWKDEKDKLFKAGKSTALVTGSVPLVNVPFFMAAHYASPEDHPNLTRIAKCVGGVIGAPTALVGIGILYSAWFLEHLLLKPKRMIYNEPGFVDDLKRTHRASAKARLNDWNTKLKAAYLLFEPEFEERADLACDLEFHLYNKLRGTPFEEYGCFDIEDKGLPFDITRHTLLVTLQVANFGYAARWMHEVRRYLTALPTTVGLIGPVQAGKSTFAQLAFGVPTPNGTGMASRTRVMRRFSGITAEPLNRQFAVIDFPGSTDVVGADLYIRGLSFVSVLLVFMNMTDLTSIGGRDSILEALKARRKNGNISALFCFTHADQVYDKYEDEVARCNSHKEVPQIFKDNWKRYQNELMGSLAGKGCNEDDLKYVRDNMHACNFRSSLQETRLPPHQETIRAQKDPIRARREERKAEINALKAQDMTEMGIKNVAWVKNWCFQSLARIS